LRNGLVRRPALRYFGQTAQEVVAPATMRHSIPALTAAKFRPVQTAQLDGLIACWNHHAELANDRPGNAPSGQPQAGGGSHAAFVGLMNANTINFAASMKIASNIGGGA
jgi:hypothetical protein